MVRGSSFEYEITFTKENIRNAVEIFQSAQPKKNRMVHGIQKI